MKERIELLVRALNLTLAQFADAIGVQKSSVSHILSGRNNPSLDFVQKILLRFTDVNTEWLLFGRGTMFAMGVADKPELTLPESNIQPEASELDLFSETESANSQKNNLPSQEKVKEDRIISIDKNIEKEKDNTFFKDNILIEDPVKKTSPESPSKKSLEIEKIVVFYKNKTFTEYYPEN